MGLFFLGAYVSMTYVIGFRWFKGNSWTVTGFFMWLLSPIFVPFYVLLALFLST